MIRVEEAVSGDAAQMSEILTEVLEAWGSQRPRSPKHVLENYIQHPDRIRCSVAIEGTRRLLGFQSLNVASEGNPYDLPTGWGIIGTYVAARARGKGVGKLLFASSREAALSAGLSEVDATIGETNQTALAYYTALGFNTYQTKPGAICKRLRLQQPSGPGIGKVETLAKP